MPRKTKKQKIIADYRRKIINLQKQQFSNLISPNIYQKPPIILTSQQTIEKKEKNFIFDKDNKEKELDNEKKFFLEDIKKSLIISSIILLFLFLFYWLKNYLLII